MPQAGEDVGVYMVRALKTALGHKSFYELRRSRPDAVRATVVELRFEDES
ncbi:MAG: hypothetical protein LBK42_04100 [Propionibacteriaceae bacterium]|nr:hypothetical protein [Propionibacteriaceae bacterium]